MTVVAVLATPPREGAVLPSLDETAPISAAEAAELYAAMLVDAMATVEASGGELLVNYRAVEDVPGESEPEAELRDLAEAALATPEDARFEVQVGSTPAGRIGNTITHLLEREGATTAAVLRPEAPLVRRTTIDGAAMKLRRDEVVLGPGPDGRVYYAGFSEPIDFEDALSPPAVETLTARARAAGHGVAFESLSPLAETASDLHTLVPMLRAREHAGLPVPEATFATVDDFGLRIENEDVVRE